MSDLDVADAVAGLREGYKNARISEEEYRRGLDGLLHRSGATAGVGVQRSALDAKAACELHTAQDELQQGFAARRRHIMRMRIVQDVNDGRDGKDAYPEPITPHPPPAPTVAPFTPLSPPKPSALKLSDLTVTKVLGQGAFGTVYLALRKGVGSFVAVKKIVFSATTHPSEVQKVVNEIKVMKQITGHPHIVRYIGAEKRADKSGGKVLHIMMEYVSGGSLSGVSSTFCNNKVAQEFTDDDVGDAPNTLDEETVLAYTYQITKGLAFLHKQGIVHRDVKGENVLVSTEGVVKLADFGTATMLECEKEVVGTPWFMAPEVVRSPQDAAGHGSKADVWSLGATVIQLLTGNPPLMKQLSTASACMYAIAKGAVSPLEDMPTSVSDNCRSFVGACLEREASLRPTAAALLEHTWFTPCVRAEAEANKASFAA